MIKDLDPKAIGICFDIGHATLEGGLSWPIQARLMEPYYVAVYLKDFRWKRRRKGGSPTGATSAKAPSKRSFGQPQEVRVRRPLSQHHEYKTLARARRWWIT